MIEVVQTLFHGRPEEKRSNRQEMCYDALDRLGISYDRADHEAADTIEACSEVETVLGAEICKNLFLCNRQATDFYLLIMPGKKPFKTKELSAQIGSSRLSFASGEQMEKLLGVLPGSVSVLGLLSDAQHKVRPLVDRDLLDQEYFGCHPCENTSTLKIKTADLMEKLLPYTGHSPTIVELVGE